MKIEPPIKEILPPQVRHTYRSSTDPKLIVYVVAVDVSIGDDDSDDEFIVECCDPAYKDDTENADGFEFTSDVWEKHKFTLVSG